MKQSQSDGDDRPAGLDSKSFQKEKKERAKVLGRISHTFSGGAVKEERAAAFGRISQSFSGETAKIRNTHQVESDPSSHFAFEFDRMDKNKDGWLSPSELHSALLSSGWVQDQVCSLFDLIDADHDGRITKSEYISFRLKCAPKEKSRRQASSYQPAVVDQNRHTMLSFEFDRIDKNKDGWLSISELHQGLISSGWEQDEVCKLFDIIDTNKDGRITKAEFIAFKANSWMR